MFNQWSSGEEIQQSSVIIHATNFKAFKMIFSANTTRKHIISEVKMNWRLNAKQLRVFTFEGVELNDEDFRFVKQDTKLYLCLFGQKFDSNCIYEDYRLISTIGNGEFGEVMLAEHKVTKQQVAIKFCHQQEYDANSIDFIFREVSALKFLEHKNIVEIHNSYLLHTKEIIIIMEYLRGGNLMQLLQRKKQLPELVARRIIKQICEAISYCHSKYIVHRDLKLENIMLTSPDSDQIKLVDFGLVQHALKFNQSHLNYGTLNYIAPEMLEASAEQSISVDIWAIGVIIYTLVIGEFPFKGSNPEVIHRIRKCDYTAIDPKFSIEFQNLISKILVRKHRITINEVMAHEWMQEQVLHYAPEHIDIPTIEIKRPSLMQQKLPKLELNRQQFQQKSRSSSCSQRAKVYDRIRRIKPFSQQTQYRDWQHYG